MSTEGGAYKVKGRKPGDAEEGAEIWKESQWSGLERDLEGRAVLACVPPPPPDGLFSWDWAVTLVWLTA